jgi:CRP/FNR family cyclic AMP-dependent transcriptional regulator
MLAPFGSEVERQKTAGLLAEQEVVGHHRVVAHKLAGIATIENCSEGKQLYLQGDAGKDGLFLVLGGSVELLVKDKPVTTVRAGECFGEFPILGLTLGYAVTARVVEKAFVARVPEQQFLAIANDHPEIWKNMAKMLARRLQEANRSREMIAARPVIKPGELTLGELRDGLSLVQLWAILGTIAGVLGTVASISYQIGAGTWP